MVKLRAFIRCFEHGINVVDKGKLYGRRKEKWILAIYFIHAFVSGLIVVENVF